MRERIDRFDWSSTPIGPRDRWPQSLRTLVELCLASRFPMMLWWGPELTYFYNDAYVPILGHRHPSALGANGEHVWADIWPILKPQVDAVLLRGESTWNERVKLVMNRTGTPEDNWFSWSYCPVYDESGNIAGLYNTCHEDTTEVMLAHERDEQLERTRHAESRVRAILESISDSFISFDRDFRFIYVNPQTERMLGMEPGSLLQKGLFDLFPGMHGSVFETAYRRTMDERVPTRTVAYYPDHLRWYDVSAYPSAEGISLFVRDVSEQENARRELEQSGRMKDEFLATLSHELRTPLSAILGWSQILRRGGARPGMIEDGLATIERNARAQTQIIDDLLDMSRIVAGKLSLDARPIDLSSAIRAAIDTVQAAATAKRIDIAFDGNDQSRPVLGDVNRLQQVFWNLLSNAIKFTPRGGIVRVAVGREQSQWQVDVSDTGEGISPAFLPYVFDRFRQADASTTRKHGGLGLGLAIVKQLIELHGGSVGADSAGAGLGSTFSVRLPMRALAESAVDPAAEIGDLPWDATAREDLRGMYVLVVDDESDAREMLRHVLTECGATVDEAPDVAGAMMRFRSRVPDLLVSDIGMPGEDGYAFIRRVRELPKEQGGTVPAIALTAYARAEDRVKALRAGFQMHVPKPVEPAELVAAIGSLVKRI